MVWNMHGDIESVGVSDALDELDAELAVHAPPHMRDLIMEAERRRQVRAEMLGESFAGAWWWNP